MLKNHKVLLVVNPISGGIDKSQLIEKTRQKLIKEEGELSIFNTSGKNDKENVAEEITRFRPDRLLIAGGDGTLKLIAEVLAGQEIPIGLLPAGSANGLAENLHLPENVDQMLQVALGHCFTSVDCILVNGELCLHISDIGLNAALIKNYEEGNVRGKLGYLIQSIPTLIKSDFPFEFEIKVGGKKIEREAVLLAIANAKKYGTGSTINPDGKYNDGVFEILIFKKFDIPQILKSFQEKVTLSEDFIEIIPASSVNIRCIKKVPFQIDGEYRGEVMDVQAQISPNKIKIAIPEQHEQ